MATTPTMGLVLPTLNDKKGDTIDKDLPGNFTIIDGLFPIGTIYQSTRNVNPHEFIGGTWTPLQGRVLVGAGTDFPAGTTGGEKEHTLTIEEMPTHTHNTLNEGNVSTGSSYTIPALNGPIASAHQASAPSGDGQPHNNMPPYRAVYMWERTA